MFIYTECRGTGNFRVAVSNFERVREFFPKPHAQFLLNWAEHVELLILKKPHSNAGLGPPPSLLGQKSVAIDYH